MWLCQSKIAIFVVAAISECLIYAEAKYCAFEIHGEPKYYVCPRTEYCCNFGCCVSPGFQIYHLWYYWLLVIIMFLVCSGGGWWYRYWLQGRYRPSASAIPPRTSNSRAQNALSGPTCRAQQARVTYNPARNTVFLHRMWKGPQRNTTPPAYNGVAASSAQFQNTNVVLNDNTCPYYELYGPPPSYETVIAQTRGKILSPTAAPTTAEHTRTTMAQTLPSLQNQNIAHCFSHNSYSSLPARIIHSDNDIGERRNSCGSNLEESAENYQNFGYKNFVRKGDARQVSRLGGGNAPLENFCCESTASGMRRSGVPDNIIKMLPFRMPEKSSEQRNDGAGNSTSSNDNLTIVGANGSGEHNQSGICAPSCQKPIKLNNLEIEIMETEEPSNEKHTTRLDCSVSRIPKIFMYSKGEARTDGIGSKYHRASSSSLKLRPGGSKGTELREGYCDVHRKEDGEAIDKQTGESSSSDWTEATAATSTSRSTKNINFNFNCKECIARNGGSNYSELNPSNNVISPSSNPNVQIINHSSLPPINIIENYQHYPPISTSPAQRSTSTNYESENKLGRSRSLD